MTNILKYIKTGSVFLLVVLVMPSCSDFLEENPKHTVATSNFYTTQEDAVAAVNSIYGSLNSTSVGNTAGVYHSTFWVTAGLASDEMYNEQLFAPDLDQISNFTHGPQNATLLDVWTKHYKSITLANIAIERIPMISMEATMRNRLLNEAKFLRGLLYFDMVRMFGSIPLVIKEVEPLTPTPAPVEAIYEQIITDLTDAESLPPSYPGGSNKEIGRATSGAAKSILAKVYLTRQQWDKAAEKSLEVIESGEYGLWDDFADVFKLANRNGKEAIFSIGFGDGGGAISFWEVAQFLVRLLPRELVAEGVENAQGWQVPTQQLYDSYDPEDRRRAVTFITEAGGKTIKPYIQKYWDRAAEPIGNESEADYPVIRYSDVLLMYAEAMNELDDPVEAHKYINMVRKRARFDGTVEKNTVPDYVNLSKEDFRAAVLNERRLEFVAEGQRWFDLVRTETLETLVPVAKPGIQPSSTHYLFPIPQRERDVNPNLPQNTGY